MFRDEPAEGCILGLLCCTLRMRRSTIREQETIAIMAEYERLSSFQPRDTDRITPLERAESKDIFGDEALHPPASPQSSSPIIHSGENHSNTSNEGGVGVTESQNSSSYHEKLFILCFGCVLVLMVRSRTKYRHSSMAPLVSPGTSTLILSSCRRCTRQREARASIQHASRMELQSLFHSLRISPYVVQQMYSYNVMKAVAGNSVLILTHDGGVAYEPWETIFDKLPEDCEVYGISTDVRRNLVADNVIMSSIPAAFM